jgi:electron transfer flavoprotein alpha subunit
MALANAWVVGETTPDGPTPLSLELVAAARALADHVSVITWNGYGSDAASSYGSHGVSAIYELGPISGMPGAPVAAAIAAQVVAAQPGVVVIGTTYDGRDIAGRLSARLDKTVATNVIGLELDGTNVLARNAIFGGATVVTTELSGSAPHLVLVRAKSFAAEEVAGSPAEVSTWPIPELGAIGTPTIEQRHVEERTGPALDEAGVVVSGGRGLGDADKYAMVEELAKLLGGAPGATRAIVDAGWVPYAYQVGQTGKTVKPNLYIALGISGATQHLVGMKGAKRIIAINKDKDAPIFGVADLGIVGDVHKIVPKLIEAIKAR